MTGYVSKEQWGIRYDGAPPATIPGRAPYVFVHHTVGGPWGSVSETMRELDEFARGQGFACVHYSWAHFNDGHRAEGRGWFARGGHTGGRDSAGRSYNEYGYGLVAVGNYENLQPTDALLDAFAVTIAVGVTIGAIDPQFTIRGHRDVKATACPGARLYPLVDEIGRRAHALLEQPLPELPEGDEMVKLVKSDDRSDSTLWLTNGLWKRRVDEIGVLSLVQAGILENGNAATLSARVLRFTPESPKVATKE